MNKMVMIGLAAAAMVLTACGPKHLNEEYSKYDPSMSKAMNLALLTGLTTKDGPLKDSEPVSVTKAISDPLKSTHAIETATNTAMLAAQSTGVMLDSGMGIGGSMGMSAVGLLLGSRQVAFYQPVLRTTIFSWMPISLAENKVDAAMLMLNILHNKTAKKLEKMGAKITISEVTQPNIFDSEHYALFEYTLNNRYYQTSLKVREPYVIDSYFFKSKSAKYYYWSYQTNSDDSAPFIAFGTIRLNENHLIMKQDSEDQATKVELFTSVAKALPSYAYTYIAPDLKAKQPPYFLNKDKKLQFIKPLL